MIEASVHLDRQRALRRLGHLAALHRAWIPQPRRPPTRPMELVLIALCGCTASDVVGILRKKREPFTALEVRAEARTRRRLSRRLYLDSPDLHGSRPGVAKNRWKTPCASRKKNTAPSPPCSRRPPKSPTPSSTLREGGAHPPPPLAATSTSRSAALSLGDLGHPGPRGLHRPSPARLLGESLEDD